jgi:hypothetical protein
MAQLKDLLPQIPKDELAILRKLNQQLDESNLTEATAKETAQAVREIIQNWKTWSKVTVAAMLLIPNIANALEIYSPETLNAIRTEVPAETPTKTITPAPIPGEVISFNFGENFDSGKATLADKEGLNKGIKDIEKWIKGKNLKNFKIVITASESQVTNPKGFEKKGSLAQARAKAIEDLVSNLGFNKIEINTKQGTTAYKAGVNNPDDPKYKAEQFVTVSIVVENSVCSMVPFEESGDQGTYEEYISGKGNLVLYTGTIPDRLVVLDVNGKIKQDTGYIATEETNSKSGYQEWKYVPIYVLKLTELKGNQDLMGSKVETIKATSYEDLVSQMLKPGAKQTKSDTVDEVLSKLEAMFKGGGTKEFVVYKVGTGDLKVPFDDSKGDVKAKVFSPVGKTGFSIKGSCTK